MSDNKNYSTIGTVLLVGLAAGAAAWYFLKTEKGKETAENLVDSFKDLSSNIKDKASDSFASVTDKAKTVINNLRNKSTQTAGNYNV